MSVPMTRHELIMVGRGDVSEYALRTIVALRETRDDEFVVIKGRGENICKAIDVYNEVKMRLGDALKLIGVDIGSERAGRRKVSYIEIKLKIEI